MNKKKDAIDKSKFTQVQVSIEDRKTIRLIALEKGIRTFEVIELLLKQYKG